MCGAVGVQYSSKLEKALRNFYSIEQIKKFKAQGEAIFAYWDPRPLLPIITQDGIRILDWGNRDNLVGYDLNIM